VIVRNNAEIDVERLEAHVEKLRGLRRRSHVSAAELPVAGREGAERDGEAPADDAPPTQAAVEIHPERQSAAPAASPDAHAGAAGSETTATSPRGWRARVAAIPVAGRLIAFLGALVRLAGFRRDVVEVHELLRAELSRMRDAQSRSELAIAQLARAQAQEPRVQAGIPDLQARQLERLEQRCAALENRLAAQTRTIRLLEQANRTAPDVPSEARAGSRSATVSGDFDRTAQQGAVPGGFYAEFEARFRGTREAVKERQRTYLAPVRRATAARSGARCVDIGCGRGEWLELLAEEGLEAVGFDLDPSMAGEARQAGLDARVGDGIAWLEQQAPASIDVVTAFQVIEHLPFEALIRLFDAALRALTPDGVAIFETPNPENLLVATGSFYLDPTHQRPIPPALAEFLGQQRGFGRVELLRTNALPEWMHVAGDGEVAHRLNALLYGAQDYALIAWKTARAPAD